MILRGDFLSEILHVTTNIQMLIPEQGREPFRVVYLLHGLHGDQGTWIDNTQLALYAKQYNAVFVMPEAPRSFYANLKYGRKYYDYISGELPVMCKKIFNVSGRREDTAVMGCSMGAYGSLRLALSKPDQYGFCGSISAACLYFRHILDSLRDDPDSYLKTGPEAEETLTDLYAIYGDALEYRDDYDILELVKNFGADRPKPKIFAVCGTEDSLRNDNLKFRDEMKNTGFDFTYEEWQGDHEWYFFNEALKKTIEFWYKV
uniref:Acetyl esterase n=1 Tax=uncultured bacterium contig00037 TaxID=1181525 RepID=A0A806JY16_9BACT|nr:acetyl esterase [uncultured bacterium contig00037]